MSVSPFEIDFMFAELSLRVDDKGVGKNQLCTREVLDDPSNRDIKQYTPRIIFRDLCFIEKEGTHRLQLAR